ncbi:transcriptional regulator [Candidatus Magnetomoraceae bacterium gMMP-15]
MPTIRQQIIDLLSGEEFDARGISQELSIREKEVYAHLSHIARSVASKKRKLFIIPSKCRACGYIFRSRKRFTRPGRCPHCKSEYLQGPKYKIV